MERRSLDHGEAAALQVALSLIDDMEEDTDFLFGRDTPDDSGGSTKHDDDDDDADGAVAKPTRKRRRNRRKDEIDYLRERVVSLEVALDETKHRIANAKGVDLAQVELMSIWEEFATRQQRKREASEVENAKLRSMLESQVQVAKELLQFLQKQPREEDVPGVRALKRLQISSDNILELSHEELLKRMDAQYATTAQVFDADQEWTTRRTFRSVRLRDDNPDMGVVEIHTAWVLPFSLDLVVRVLAQRSERITIEARCQRFETQEEKDNMLVSMFTGAAQNDEGAVVEVNGRIVSRLYPEPEKQRAVILSELSVEPVNAATANFPPYAVQSQGWTRVSPYKPAGQPLASETTKHLTHIQWFRRVRIMPRSVNVSTQRRKPGMFTELVLAHIGEDLDQSQHVIEDLLMEDVLAQSGNGTSSSSNSSSASQDEDRDSHRGSPVSSSADAKASPLKQVNGDNGEEELIVVL